MSPRPLGLALLVALAAACGHGATQYSGNPPTPDQVYGQCAFCHNDLAAEMTADGGHATLNIKCQQCHDDLTPGMVGCGHESIPRCPDCHRAQITHHDPAVAAPQQCTLCHTPHGSPNILLIRTAVPLSDPANMTTPFTNLAGRADGSFASASDPGTGICEVCHTTTKFYRSDGMGAAHFQGACYTCHPHASSFLPQ